MCLIFVGLEVSLWFRCCRIAFLLFQMYSLCLLNVTSINLFLVGVRFICDQERDLEHCLNQDRHHRSSLHLIYMQVFFFEKQFWCLFYMVKRTPPVHMLGMHSR